MLKTSVAARQASLQLALMAALSLSTLDAWQDPAPTFRSGVDVVPVDVSVLDKNRKPVRGLTAADFTVYEDGKPRPILTFAPVELPAPAPPAPAIAAWTRDVPRDLVTNAVAHEGRLIVIVMDRSIRFDDQKTARAIALKTVDELAPGDLAALAFTSQFAGRGKSVDFTSDRARLRQAIEAPFAVAAVEGPAQSLIDWRNEYSGDCYCGACVLDSISRIADSVRDVVGRRKILFFIGTYARAEEAMSPGRSNPCTTTLSHARERMVRSVQLANLSMVTFDAVGIEGCFGGPLPKTLMTCNRVIAQRQAELSSLAGVVRGRTILNTNTPEVQVASVLEESSAYYLLGIDRASAVADGRDHKIEVKTRRSGLTIYSRKGYVAPRPDSSTRPMPTASMLSAPNLAAVTGVLPRTELSLGASVASFVANKDESLVTVAIHVQRPMDIRDSRAVPGSRRAEIALAAFNRLGESVAVVKQTAELTGPASGIGTLRYEVLTHLTLKPGHYDLRVAATDATTGDTGSVHTTIDVPDLSDGRLAISDLVLTQAAEMPGAVPDELAALLPVMPTTKRAFAANEHPAVFVRAYQGGKDPLLALPLTVRILDTSNRPVLERTVTIGADRFGATRSADHLFELPLASLAKGEYLLSMSATLDRRTVRRDLRFNVN